MRLLVTRPEPGASRTALALRAAGHEALTVPLMEIRPTGTSLPAGPFDAIVLTSAQALAMLEAMARNVPVFTVGDATASAAREAGFTDVRAGPGTAPGLARWLPSALPGGTRLLYPCAVEVAHDLDQMLAGSGLAVHPVAVYEARAADRLPARIVRLWSTLDGVLLHSARAAATLAGLVARLGLDPPPAYCLSHAVAAALEPWDAPVRIAQEPRDEALRSLIRN